MASLIAYWKVVAQRAWSEARRRVVPKSLSVISVEATIFVIACLLASRGQTLLSYLGIQNYDDPTLGNIITAGSVVLSLVVVFGVYFLFELLFVSPFRIWNELQRATGPAHVCLVTFSLRPTRSSADAQALNLVITAAEPLRAVIVTGRFAILTHYLTDTLWTWTFPIRLASCDDLRAGEVIEIALVSRERLKSNPDDKTFLLTKPLPLDRHADMAQGEIVRVEVSVEVGSRKQLYEKVFNFRRAEGRQFIDTLELDTLRYSDDTRTL